MLEGTAEMFVAKQHTNTFCQQHGITIKKKKEREKLKTKQQHQQQQQMNPEFTTNLSCKHH